MKDYIWIDGIRENVVFEADYSDYNIHREDGPAMDFANGGQFWYINNKRHRIDGPAIITSNGARHWYIHGKRHRINGPATILVDGIKLWWINGNHIPTEEMKLWLKENNINLITPEGQMAIILRWG